MNEADEPSRCQEAASACSTAAPRSGAPLLLFGALSMVVLRPIPALLSLRRCSRAAVSVGGG